MNLKELALLCCITLTVLAENGAAAGTLSDEYILAEAKTFASLVGEGRFVAAAGRFDPALAKVMDASKLRVAWQTSTKALGEFVRVSDASVKSDSRHQTVVVTCEFEKQLADLEVRFSPGGRVITFYLFTSRESPSSRIQSIHEKDRNIGPWVLCIGVVGLAACLLTTLRIVRNKKRGKA